MESLVVSLVERWHDARALGRDISPEELCAEHPDLLEQVRAVIRVTHLTMSRAAERTPSPGPPSLVGELQRFFGPAERPDEIGRLGEYRLIDLLGEGGMGAVFRAEDTSLGRLVALKVMRPEIAASAKQRQRFLHKARNAASLDHDHIVQIFRIGESNGIPFLVMPLLQGETLGGRLGREGRIPPADLVRVGREVAEGLAAAHGRGVIHRDIKPSNLWLDAGRDGSFRRAHILDFGLALLADGSDHFSTTGAVLGTPAYMAPEQANGRPVDFRSDLFSLGCVLYHCGAGVSPFQHGNLATLSALATEVPPPLDRVNPAIPPEVSALVARLLEKHPDARPASAMEVAFHLAKCSPAPPSGGEATWQLPPRARPGRKALRGVAWVTGAGLLVAAGAIGARLAAPEPAKTAPKSTPSAPSATTKSDPSEVVRRYEEALSLRRRGQNAAALDAFRRVLEVEPNDPDALMEIGTLELQSNRVSAEAAFAQLLRIDPENLKARLGEAIAGLESTGRVSAPQFVLPTNPDANTLTLLGFLAAGENLAGRSPSGLPIDALEVVVAYLRRGHDPDSAWVVPKLVYLDAAPKSPGSVEVTEWVVRSLAKTRVVRKVLPRGEARDFTEVVYVGEAVPVTKLVELPPRAIQTWDGSRLLPADAKTPLTGRPAFVFATRLQAQATAQQFLASGAVVIIDAELSRPYIQTPAVAPMGPEEKEVPKADPKNPPAPPGKGPFGSNDPRQLNRGDDP